MKIESFLFWTAVAGDLIILFYGAKHAFRAVKLFRENLAKSLWSASAACGLLGFAMLLPWSLVSHEREIGKAALVICILVPFVMLWPHLKSAIFRVPALAWDAIIFGMVLAFFASGNWAWFLASVIVMAIIWIVARKMMPKKPRLSVESGEKDHVYDPFGYNSPFFSDDTNDPNDPSWRLGHH